MNAPEAVLVYGLAALGSAGLVVLVVLIALCLRSLGRDASDWLARTLVSGKGPVSRMLRAHVVKTLAGIHGSELAAEALLQSWVAGEISTDDLRAVNREAQQPKSMRKYIPNDQSVELYLVELQDPQRPTVAEVQQAQSLTRPARDRYHGEPS